MKEIEQIGKDKIVITDQQEKKLRAKYMGSIRPKKGHTLFKINTENGEISEAEFLQEEFKWDEAGKKKLGTKKKVLVEKGFIYMSALNKKNVARKLMKDLR